MTTMKLKNGYALRSVAGEWVALPKGRDIDLNTMITLNDTGAFLWERLQNGATEDELVAALRGEYDVDEATARRSVQGFVEKLKSHGLLD